MATVDFAIGIGGEAGQGIATPGDILARIFARRGLNLHAYNAYQSIIRGGQPFLTLPAASSPAPGLGAQPAVPLSPKPDRRKQHPRLMPAGACVMLASSTMYT